ncbi:MAG: ABC transporter ATP-binding protein [Ruminococcus sp.]|nr:ABC transporter ATP-binding protein [Ruminococcus sp.]
MLELKNITKEYNTDSGSFKAVDNVSLTIEKGSMTALIGKSGSGKSTLLNIISGLTKPTSGEIVFCGKKLGLSQRAMSDFRYEHIGFVVQNFALVNQKTAFDNIALPLKNSRSKKSAKKIEEISKRLGIYDKLSQYPYNMSGGECQRVAIARALINEPDIILADEPTGALDSKTSAEIMDLFKALNSHGRTVIIVTHDKDIASQCGRIIEISDGRISGREQ